MKLTYLYLLSFILINSIIFAQKSNDETRQKKIEIILQMQDTRTIHDGKLISFLTDTDAVVRAKAVIAFGNIQDTSTLSLLVDKLTEDPDSAARFNAAFAIGQTANLLSNNNKKQFQHDLIWNRIDKISGTPKERMIEEIGKFGTEEALSDLILKFGIDNQPATIDALTMSISRFAIRGIKTKEAVRYLLKHVKPDDKTDWKIIYALQRIGDHPEIRSNLEIIVKLFKQKNPFIRMNLAVLLGKVKDEKICLESLQKLAEFDGDWRVKVNALRALSNYDLMEKNEFVQIFRRSFYDGNMHIAATALSAFGNTKLKNDSTNKTLRETFAALEKIAVNKGNIYPWQLQAEAVVALAKLEGKEALRLIKLSDYPQPMLQAQLLTALGLTGASEASSILFDHLNDDQPILYRSALEGLSELCKRNPIDSIIVNKTYEAFINALSVKDIAVVTTAASILGDSLFLRKESVEPLLETLSQLQVPDDIESMQEIIATLGKLKNDKAIAALKNKFEERDRSIQLAAASALKSISGKDYSSDILTYFEPIFTDFDVKYLHALKDTTRVKMETIRGDVVMELYKNYAPFTVMSFLKLAIQRGFYRGLSFHRIVPNFVVQGGDPRGDGWGGPGYSIRSEFTPLTYETGMVGMASSGKDTEGSQFFITQSPQPHLDGRYTIFGKVISGMDVVNKIQLDDHIFDIKIIQ